jgi:hypothetical protein
LAQVKLQTLYLFHIADAKEGNIKNMRAKLERGIEASVGCGTGKKSVFSTAFFCSSYENLHTNAYLKNRFPEWRGMFLIKAAQAAILESDFEAAFACLRQGVRTADEGKMIKHSVRFRLTYTYPKTSSDGIIRVINLQITFRLALAQLFLQKRELKHVPDFIDKAEKILLRIIERETAATERPRLISASTGSTGVNRSVNLSLSYDYDDSDGEVSPPIKDEDKMDVDPVPSIQQQTSPRRNFHQTSLELNSLELYRTLLPRSRANLPDLEISLNFFSPMLFSRSFENAVCNQNRKYQIHR